MAACCLLPFMLDTVVYMDRYYTHMCSCRCALAGAGVGVCTFRFWDHFILVVIMSFGIFFLPFVFLPSFCHVFPPFFWGGGSIAWLGMYYRGMVPPPPFFGSSLSCDYSPCGEFFYYSGPQLHVSGTLVLDLVY